MDFGKLISERRKALGLTLEQVGKACGVGKSTVRKWETGMIQNVGRDKLRDLAGILHMDPTRLIDLNEEQSPAQDDAWAIRDRMRADPELRVLFDAADGAKPEHLRAAVAMLRALKAKEEDNGS